MTEIEDWEAFRGRLNGFSQEDIWLIDSAYQTAKLAHRGQQRDQGERYFEHPRRTALIILDEFHLRKLELVIGGLLHDTGEDTPAFGNPVKFTYSAWKREAGFLLTRFYGTEVAEIVLAMTKPRVDGIEILSREQSDEIVLANLRAASPDAQITKLADRLHNSRTLGGVPDLSKRMRKIDETRKHYYPIFEMARKAYPEAVEYGVSQIELAFSKIKNYFEA